ncbi:MAG: hypothetical protein Q7J31_06840 [Syntrophales bacterium]|nr:hypothetical protein [Syntrophales bacterium]
MKGTYAGKIQLDDIVFPDSYKMVVEGSAFPGAIKGLTVFVLVIVGYKRSRFGLKTMVFLYERRAGKS